MAPSPMRTCRRQEVGRPGDRDQARDRAPRGHLGNWELRRGGPHSPGNRGVPREARPPQGSCCSSLSPTPSTRSGATRTPELGTGPLAGLAVMEEEAHPQGAEGSRPRALPRHGAGHTTASRQSALAPVPARPGLNLGATYLTRPRRSKSQAPGTTETQIFFKKLLHYESSLSCAPILINFSTKF